MPLSRSYAGCRRPRLPISDIAYNCVGKVYSGRSARRFDSQVRDAKGRGLTETDPALNTVLRHLRDPDLTAALEPLVRVSAKPLTAVEEKFAQDSTGSSSCTHERWYDHKWGKMQSKQQFVKLHAMTGTLTNVVTDATVNASGGDSPQFIPLLNRTAQNFSMREVSGDKAYSSKANLQAVEAVGATPYIVFRDTPTG